MSASVFFRYDIGELCSPLNPTSVSSTWVWGIHKMVKYLKPMVHSMEQMMRSEWPWEHGALRNGSHRMPLLSPDVPHDDTKEPCSPEIRVQFSSTAGFWASVTLRLSVRARSSPKWLLTGCPCYPRMCHLAVWRQMRPSRQYWQLPANPNPWNPQIPNWGMLGFAAVPWGFADLNFRHRFNQNSPTLSAWILFKKRIVVTSQNRNYSHVICMFWALAQFILCVYRSQDWEAK